MKRVALGLILLVWCSTILAEITVDFEGTPWQDNSWSEKFITVTNNTPIPWYIDAFQFEVQNDVWNGCEGGKISTLTTTAPYLVQVTVPKIDENFGTDGYNRRVKIWGNPNGKDGTPSNPSLLLKTGSHFWPLEDIPYAEPISVKQIDSLMATADFYNKDLAILDTLGQRGGPLNSGLIDTWYGLTQIQSAHPVDPFYQNNSWMTFEPKAYGNSMYMMALAAMQEYLNIDMQILIAKGGGENMAGMVNWDFDSNGPIKKLGTIYGGSGNNGLSGLDFSPFSVEYQTYNDYVFDAYPKFFPYGSSQPSGSVKNDYFSTTLGTNYCELFSPNVVNGCFNACLYNWFTFQLGINSTDYGFAEMIKKGKDPQGPMKLALWAFNRGINTQWLETVNDPSALTYEKLEEYPNIAQNGKDYIAKISTGLNPMIEAARNSTTLGGTEPIYDDTISIEIIELFLFGEGGKGNNGKRGNGGLLVHFNLTAEEMVQIWSDVESAFNKLKGASPYTATYPNMISYRYDFLTILRVVKQYIDVSVPLPTTQNYVSWVGSRSGNSITFSGETVDKEYPSFTVKDTLMEPKLSFIIEAKDNIGIRSVSWTVDSSWQKWHSATSQNDEHVANITDKDLMFFQSGDSARVWLRVTDTWGQSYLKEYHVGYPIPTPLVTTNLSQKENELTLSKIGTEMFRIDNIENSATPISVTLYNLQGQQVYSVEKRVSHGSLELRMNSIPSGLYLIKLSNGIKEQVLKLNLW